MKKIILALLLALPVMAAAQNRHLDDLRAGESVQFEYNTEKGYVLVAMRKLDDAFLATIHYSPNEPEKDLFVAEIKGEQINLHLLEDPLKRDVFCIAFDKDDPEYAKLYLVGETKFVWLRRKYVVTKK